MKYNTPVTNLFTQLKTNFLASPEYIQLSAGAKMAQITLLTRRSPHITGVAISKPELAESIGQSKRTVDRVISELQTAGWIRIQTDDGLENVYHVTNPVIDSGTQFTQLPHRLISSQKFKRLSPYARLTMIHLLTYSNADSKPVWPSKPTLARRTGFSTRTIDRSILDLEAAGLIRVDRRAAHNVYHFQIPPPMTAESLPVQLREATRAIQTPPPVQSRRPIQNQSLNQKENNKHVAHQTKPQPLPRSDRDVVVTASISPELPKAIPLTPQDTQFLESICLSPQAIQRAIGSRTVDIALILASARGEYERGTCRNPAGWILSAIRHDWVLATPEAEALKAQRERADRDNAQRVAAERRLQELNSIREQQEAMERRLAKAADLEKNHPDEWNAAWNQALDAVTKSNPILATWLKSPGTSKYDRAVTMVRDLLIHKLYA